jgi:paired amphipathic helix protein Sin3a
MDQHYHQLLYIHFEYIELIGHTQSKKQKQSHRPDVDDAGYSPYQIHPSPQMVNVHASVAPGLQHTNSGQLLVHSSAGYGMTTPDELMFFDRAKKALDTREAYEDFLKLLNLFSKDIIDAKTLVDRAEVFLGDGDLLVEFKELMAYDDPKTRAERGPPGSVRMREPEPLVAQPPDDDLGPSYRRLPESVSCCPVEPWINRELFLIGDLSGLLGP